MTDESSGELNYPRLLLSVAALCAVLAIGYFLSVFFGARLGSRASSEVPARPLTAEEKAQIMQSLASSTTSHKPTLPAGQKVSAQAKAAVTSQTADENDPYAAEKMQILMNLNAH